MRDTQPNNSLIFTRPACINTNFGGLRHSRRAIQQLVMNTLPPGSFYGPAPPRKAKVSTQPLSTPSNIPATPSTPVVPSTPLDPVTPLVIHSSTPVPSTQPRLCAPKRTKWQKVDSIVQTIARDFRSLGAFLEVLFHIKDYPGHDPRTTSHEHMVTAFLEGTSNVGMARIIDLIYHHPQSRPSMDHPDSWLYFSPPDIAAPQYISFAKPALSTWALHCIGPEMRRQIGILTENDPTDPNDITQLRASTNGHAKHVRLATWDDLGRVSIPWMAGTYKRRAPCRVQCW